MKWLYSSHCVNHNVHCGYSCSEARKQIGSDQAPRFLTIDEFLRSCCGLGQYQLTGVKMKERELNRANIGVAKTTAMSGRATANEINSQKCEKYVNETNAAGSR